MNSIIFWNVAKTSDVNIIANLCQEYSPDVLILAEAWNVAEVDLLKSINQFREQKYRTVNPNAIRVRIYSLFPAKLTISIADERHFSAAIIKPPLGPDYLLVGVHLPSKTNHEATAQSILAARVAEKIAELEEIHSLNETVVIGDFNMNPFEPGLINSDGFHAVMDRNVALRGSRTVQDEVCKFFYNPMWGLHGDALDGPSGSYFYQSATPICYFWNIFDQAILRPSLIPRLSKVPVAFIEKIGDFSLLMNSRPDSNVSDHLPIKLVFKSNNEV